MLRPMLITACALALVLGDHVKFRENPSLVHADGDNPDALEVDFSFWNDYPVPVDFGTEGGALIQEYTPGSGSGIAKWRTARKYVVMNSTKYGTQKVPITNDLDGKMLIGRAPSLLEDPVRLQEEAWYLQFGGVGVLTLLLLFPSSFLARITRPLELLRGITMCLFKVGGQFLIATLGGYLIESTIVDCRKHSRLIPGGPSMWTWVDSEMCPDWQAQNTWMNYAIRSCATWFAFFFQYAWIAGFVQLCAMTVYKSTPYFHNEHGQDLAGTATKVVSGISGGDEGHDDVEDMQEVSGGAFYTTTPKDVKLTTEHMARQGRKPVLEQPFHFLSNGCGWLIIVPFLVNAFSSRERIGAFGGSFLMGSLMSGGYSSLAASYVRLIVASQVALAVSDFGYWSWHILQHNIRSVYRISDHNYHHQFKHPVAFVGPWLSPIDLLVSGLLTFAFPAVAVEFLLGRSLPVQDVLLIFGWVHEMNSEDHSGKRNPDWSGCPMCPPLGFAFGLENCVDMHEAHHNWGRCSYGLLGVADRVFGTDRYASDPARNRGLDKVTRDRRHRSAIRFAYLTLIVSTVLMAHGGLLRTVGIHPHHVATVLKEPLTWF